jgi:hypothetical protein
VIQIALLLRNGVLFTLNRGRHSGAIRSQNSCELGILAISKSSGLARSCTSCEAEHGIRILGENPLFSELNSISGTLSMWSKSLYFSLIQGIRGPTRGAYRVDQYKGLLHRPS